MIVYSAIYGGRDTIHPPKWTHESVRVICYTDDPSLEAKGVQVICDPSPHKEPARASRYWKTHPPKGDSIWIDGTYQLTGDPRPYVAAVTKQVALVRHERQDCLFREAIQTAARNKDEPSRILRQAMKYDREGMPSNFGLWEGGIIIRRKGCPRLWQDAWWQEILDESCRDQLSLAYVLWKYRQEFDELDSRPRCFTMHEHAKDVRISKPGKKLK